MLENSNEPFEIVVRGPETGQQVKRKNQIPWSKTKNAGQCQTGSDNGSSPTELMCQREKLQIAPSWKILKSGWKLSREIRRCNQCLLWCRMRKALRAAFLFSTTGTFDAEVWSVWNITAASGSRGVAAGTKWGRATRDTELEVGFFFTRQVRQNLLSFYCHYPLNNSRLFVSTILSDHRSLRSFQVLTNDVKENIQFVFFL